MSSKIPPSKRRGWLKNGNQPGDPQAAARCGAKTRRGAGCQAPAMPNGRCRMHGGLSTGPKTAEGKDRIRRAVTKHGRYSAATKLRQERYVQILLGPHFKGKLEVLKSLREPIRPENSRYLAPGTEEWDPLVAAATDEASALIPPDSSRLESSRGPSLDLESTSNGEEVPATSESWQWSPSKKTAASLVAEGRLRIYEIAQQVGVSEKTIDRWKKHPAFSARVDEIVTNFRNQLFAESLRRYDRDLL